jgi:hypothetical protein
MALTLVHSVIADDTQPSPAADLQKLQGVWKVDSVSHPDHKDGIPKSAFLDDTKTLLSIEGHRVLHDGKVVATLNNDVADAPESKEVGWSVNRLLKLTLTDGKSVWCSYRFDANRVQITCPHTTSCHRGSGQITYLVPVK